MAMDFYLLEVKPERLNDAVTIGGKPKRGFARIKFLDLKPHDKSSELYDLRGGIATHRQFQNWAKREFGYLRYEVDFG